MGEVEHVSDDRPWSETVNLEHLNGAAAKIDTEHDFNASNCGITLQRADSLYYLWWNTVSKVGTLSDLDALIEVVQRLRDRIADTET